MEGSPCISLSCGLFGTARREAHQRLLKMMAPSSNPHNDRVTEGRTSQLCFAPATSLDNALSAQPRLGPRPSATPEG